MAPTRWIMRPRALVEVVERSRHDGDWDHSLREFLDTVYLADGNATRHASLIATEPG